MAEIPLDDDLTEDNIWSILGIMLSNAAWETLDIEDALAQTQKSGGRRPQALRAIAENLLATIADPPADLTHGRLFVAALIKDVQRYVIDLYCVEDQPAVIGNALTWAGKHLGSNRVDAPLLNFTALFPPPPVRRGDTAPSDHLDEVRLQRPNRERAVREMAVLYLAIANPAMRAYLPLFDDAELRQRAPYTTFMQALEAFFQKQPAVRELGETLFQLLRKPMEEHPNDLEGQLDFILKHWAKLLPDWLLDRLLRARDVLREETIARGAGGPPQAPFYRDDNEREAFTPDREWMANVVLIAKQTYVWLDQLSREYDRPIRRLDQVPDGELDKLARWGFTGLWLIGVYERSPASREIKRRMGNPEALSSAYSLFDYVVAEDLGGYASYENLNRRAWARGIRLAADMVPNHVGIYSKWVVEHPDWFLQLDHPPFPGYSFTGPDLSWDPHVEVRIEDGYWDHTDAAVVFQRVDNRYGDVRYIYHGNDGTQMPWNDTAQLDYLNPEVREAVVQTIIHVARQFSIIRFDAAMTLAKRHFRRLWFPAPGEGGAIPSRAERAISPEAFDQAFPVEFWREVVDRIGEELPDTLLLAEAFWMMEGYFVRSLGMHRVYNSAFMNMLKMEDNSRYRQTIKDVIEFTPEILKRFVNFMNNPDERTAVEQFGKGDKYFGISTLMVTLPGLPMFGHGQIEGYSEKYGMEFARAYWDEQPDAELIARHEHDIFPLMSRRHLFSQIDNFVFYDFFTNEGHVNENVFVFSNMGGGERGLVVYNNAYSRTAGWVRTSVPVNRGSSSDIRLETPTLAQGLQLNPSGSCLHAFRDHNADLWFLRTGAELAERGLFAELTEYGCHVFLDWREIAVPDRLWWQLHNELDGAGVPDVDEARLMIRLRPIHELFHQLLDPALVDAALGFEPAAAEADDDEEESEVIEVLDTDEARTSLLKAFGAFLQEADTYPPGVNEPSERVAELGARLERLGALTARAAAVRGAMGTRDRGRLGYLFALLRSLADSSRAAAERSWAWRLGGQLHLAYADRDPQAAAVTARVAPILLDHAPKPIHRGFFERPDITEHLLVHESEDTVWFHKERMDLLLEAIELIRAVELPEAADGGLASVRRADKRAAYQFTKLLEGLEDVAVAWVPTEALVEEDGDEESPEDGEGDEDS